jgi:hypothetical protein
MKMKNAKKPIVLMFSTMLEIGERRPSHPAKRAATMPTQPIHRGTTRVLSTAIAKSGVVTPQTKMSPK